MSGPHPEGHRLGTSSRWAFLTLLTAALAVATHLSRVTWGLDRTDEGQYLLLLADPSTSRGTVFLFGHVLHPLFVLVGGDIALLRALGVGVSVVAAGVLGWAVTSSLGLRGVPAWVVRGVAASCGLAPLLYFPLTPSYNTLAFWGACLWAAGLVLLTAGELPTEAPVVTRSVGPGVLLGVGGVVAASGKVTSGAALAALTLLVMVALVLTRREDAPRVLAGLVGGALGALAAVAALVGHGPAWFAEFYRDGARGVSLLRGHEHLVRWDPIPWAGLVSLPALVILGGVVVAATALRTVASRLVLVGLAAAALLVGPPPIGSPVMTALGWWVPLLALLCARRRPHVARATPHRTLLTPVVVLALALTPLAYVVGTNGNYWISQGRGVVFWFAALLLLLRAPEARRLASTTTAALVLALVLCGLGHAYRYAPPTRAWTDPASTAVGVVSPEGARLRLTTEDAQTSAELARLRRELGPTGVPVLDVTGASPGYIRQLGGHPVGGSWLLGGYAGSLDAALEAVRGEDPDLLRRAYVLDAPDSPRRIGGLLPALGRSPERDYEEVATFRHHLGYDVRLLRPVARR